jgi:hypothetical protein
MTYIRRSVRQRQKWITLSEAIDHIVEAEKCDQNAAWEQLRDALEDGAVTCTEPLTKSELDADKPSLRRIFPRIQKRKSRGKPAYWIVRYHHVTCPTDRVWLLRESVFELWKAPEAKKEAASHDEMREVLRAICRERKEAGRPIPNVLDAPALMADKLPTKHVWIKVAQGIAGEPEFAQQRVRGRRRRKT